MLCGDLVGERARLSPERPALVDVASGARLTYRDLDALATTFTRLFRLPAAAGGWGLARGERVALLAGNSPEYVAAWLAAGKCGVVLVPLSTRATAHELAQVLADAEVSALAWSAEHAATVAALRASVAIPRFLALGDAPADDVAWRDVRGALAATDPAADPWRRERADPEDLWALLYTSGTTGRPKGVMVPHRMVLWNGYDTAIGWGLRDDDVSPIFTPLYHAGGLGAFLVPILTVGGTVVLHRGFDAAEIWRTIAAERCTVVLGVPTIWKLLLEDPGFATADLAQVRWFISGGAPLPLYLIDAYRRRGVVLKQGYGLTEVGVNCFAMSVEDAVRKAGSIGRPLPFTAARLVEEDGREVATGEVGELLLRGPHVCAGYWRDPEATAAALDADGWFHTGDLARRDDEGFFTIAGRRKDMLISGGVNVYPAEIEGELLLHPAVADAAVVGVPHPTWGEVGVAFVVPRGEAPDAAALAAFVEARLARYKVPKAFRFVDALPRTPYGKVVKGELRERWIASRRDEEVSA